MAKRPIIEQLAIARYAEGKSIEDIGQELDVSPTSLYKWKSQSKVHGEDLDEWDKRRQERMASVVLLGDLFVRTVGLYSRELQEAERMPAGKVQQSQLNAISQIGNMAIKGIKLDEAVRNERERLLPKAAAVIDEIAKQQGMDADQADFWRKQILGVR